MKFKKTYTIELIHEDDGSTKLIRTCDGFDAYELLGLLTHASHEISLQINKVLKPDKVVRQVVVDKDDAVGTTPS